MNSAFDLISAFGFLPVLFADIVYPILVELDFLIGFGNLPFHALYLSGGYGSFLFAGDGDSRFHCLTFRKTVRNLVKGSAGDCSPAFRLTPRPLEGPA